MCFWHKLAKLLRSRLPLALTGNNDAHSGCLAYTDEMIAALEEADGGEEIEFYKQSCTERNWQSQ